MMTETMENYLTPMTKDFAFKIFGNIRSESYGALQKEQAIINTLYHKHTDEIEKIYTKRQIFDVIDYLMRDYNDYPETDMEAVSKERAEEVIRTICTKEFEEKDEYEDYTNSIGIVLYSNSPEQILEKFTAEQLIRTLRYLNEELIFDINQIVEPYN